jgi:hypothetical protein
VKNPVWSTKVRKHSDYFQHQLNSYALAAGATGVGLLALRGPAEAKIVYTPIHRVIGNGAHYFLDFNHDGTTDLNIRNTGTQYCSTDGSCFPIQSLAVLPSRSNQVVYNIYGAVAMKPGMTIGPRAVFHGGAERMVWSFGNTARGSWIDVKNRYLGVKFKIKGKIHYGWARLSVQSYQMKITATLTGFAYETDVNKPIVAGKTKDNTDPSSPSTSSSRAIMAAPRPTQEPAALGMLALGSPGMPLWRPRNLTPLNPPGPS